MDYTFDLGKFCELTLVFFILSSNWTICRYIIKVIFILIYFDIIFYLFILTTVNRNIHCSMEIKQSNPYSTICAWSWCWLAGTLWFFDITFVRAFFFSKKPNLSILTILGHNYSLDGFFGTWIGSTASVYILLPLKIIWLAIILRLRMLISCPGSKHKMICYYSLNQC